jgi:SAM-dependent methyltransferase
MEDYSEKFYARHAERYAEVAHQYLQSVYIEASCPKLTGDLALIEHLKTLVPGKRGLDAGCGAGARDVYSLWRDGYDIYGVDAVKENIDTALKLHPEVADRLSVADLRKELPFATDFFDFVMCNAVIQHIEPGLVEKTTLPELCRVLKPGGILQLMFKNGDGVLTIYDKDYGTERSFQLYDEQRVLQVLAQNGMELVESRSSDGLGGVMHFTDPKGARHCVFYARKLR